VLLFAVLIAFGAQSVGRMYNRLAQIEWWGRRVTGVIMILLGLYFTLIYIYGVPVSEWLGEQIYRGIPWRST
jgi:succinate dehydrogenase hydrophobic anchor subunit